MCILRHQISDLRRSCEENGNQKPRSWWIGPRGGFRDAAGDDPWANPKRQDQRTAALRLKRVLMMILAEQGVDLPIEPDGPAVRMIDQKLVRKAFYACTPVDGTPEQKRQPRHSSSTGRWIGLRIRS